MKNFKILNNIAGWIVFLMAAIVYLLTMEPSTSLWDCGEFIASAYKLEVGHPPGASIFMLIGQLFTLFASSPAHVAIMINSMSALCSAFTILFLFWSTTHLVRRLYDRVELDLTETICILGAGLVAGLAYTFSDTFWFSAVEGEVYAMSSLFTAVVFWAILKWEEEADTAYANRWLVLIAFLMGISIGVHLLNLLTIPALIFVYYFKKYKVSTKGIISAFAVSILILGAIVFFIIPGVPSWATYFELIFVNTFGMAYNTGLLFYSILLIGLLFYFCYWTMQKGKVLLNTIALCLTMIVLGYFSLSTIVIRSSANPPMNENQPDNVFSLLSYLNREQYGDTPLIYGETFESQPIDYKYGKVYDQLNGKYENRKVLEGYEFSSEDKILFPRMWSSQPSHFDPYVKWGNMKGMAKTKEGGFTRKLTMGDNFTYMMNYQFDWMYFRYFMWNFVGRQNDFQGHGDVVRGNWISGIDFIDKARLGVDSEKLPTYLKENKGRNRYYFIPLILGLIGLFFHYSRDKRNFVVLMLLFIFTGLAIAFYLNMPPNQPRERDYVFAGSFYAFAIWIGFAVPAFLDLFRKAKLDTPAGAVLATTLCLSAPIIMGVENWDDHDRSNRYIARDIAANYLNTCGNQGIIFTFGDNDTFPLWYSQEVEGTRTDVRVCNISLLNSDWYIQQMRRKVYNSEALPMSLPERVYRKKTNEMLRMQDLAKGDTLAISRVINFVSNPENIDKRTGDNIIPCRKISIPVNKQAVLKAGIVKEKDIDLIEDYIYLTLTDRITKADLAIIDILSNYKWDRPIHFSSYSGDVNLGLESYLQYDGYAYALTPIKSKVDNSYNGGRIVTEVLYDNLMNKYHWGNMEKEGVLIDYHNLVPLGMTINARNMYCRLAQELNAEGKKEEAIKVLDYIMEMTPRTSFFYNISVLQQDLAVIDIIDTYLKAGAKDKGIELFDAFFEETKQSINFFSDLVKTNYHDLELNLYYLQKLNSIAEENKLSEEQTKVKDLFNFYMKLFGS